MGFSTLVRTSRYETVSKSKNDCVELRIIVQIVLALRGLLLTKEPGEDFLCFLLDDVGVIAAKF